MIAEFYGGPKDGMAERIDLDEPLLSFIDERSIIIGATIGEDNFAEYGSKCLRHLYFLDRWERGIVHYRFLKSVIE